MGTTLTLNESRPARPNPVETIRKELDGYLHEMQGLHRMTPEEVYRKLSAWSARVTEIKIQASRDNTPTSVGLQTNELVPFLAECDRQFKCHSRIQASVELEERTSR